jgi:hypothetical protein
LWVFQTLPHRITLIDRSFALARSYPLPPLTRAPRDPTPYPNLALLPVAAVLPGGATIRQGLVSDGDRFQGNRPVSGDYYLRANGGGVVEAVAAFFSSDASRYFVRYGPSGRLAASGELPFAPRGFDMVANDGARIVSVRPRTISTGRHVFSVVVVDSSGRRLWWRDYPFDAVSIPAPRVDSAYRAFYESRRSSDLANAIRAVVTTLPTYYPPLERLIVGNDHSIWLGLRRNSSEEMPWLVLDRDGIPRGHLFLPRNEQLMSASLQQIWTTVRDSVNVEAVHRYGIRSGRWFGRDLSHTFEPRRELPERVSRACKGRIP